MKLIFILMQLLEVVEFQKSFGGVKANVDISLQVEQGSIVGLIGPNGSGKTTLFNSIVGTHPIDKVPLNLMEKKFHNFLFQKLLS